ncbi:hypothetical protein ASF70_22315 [Rhizobium sp. Leaf321]|nr:hypothetical protein ASF70_22315 [Rhizobium sp. Leaf321]
MGGETDRPHPPDFGMLGSAKPGPMPGCIRHQPAAMDKAKFLAAPSSYRSVRQTCHVTHQRW